mmetsp:Transcript_6636/g.18888  ORF Transcript_6636/g.18888 Transcript_6636/m.18888 type:complete len:388 (+) Transcript_6636:1400-2563(+)
MRLGDGLEVGRRLEFLAVQPRELLRPALLELGDLAAGLERDADVVEALDEAVLAEGVHLEGVLLARRGLYDLVGEVDLKVLARLAHGEELLHLGARELDGEHGVLEAIVEEDVREARGDHAADTEVIDGPRRVLAAGAAAKVVAGDEDLGLAVRLLVEHKVRALRAVVLRVVPELVERRHAEAGALNGLEELLRDDHVRVDVLDIELGGDALERRELGHATGATRAASLGAAGLGHGGLLHLLLGIHSGGHELEGVGLRDAELLHGRGQGAHVGEGARHGGSGGHGRGHEVRAAAVALAALEVAVRGGRAALLGLEPVRVHGEAHGAAGLAEIEAGVREDLVEAFSDGLGLDEAGARHHHGDDAVGHLAALGHGGGGTDVLNARVGA